MIEAHRKGGAERVLLGIITGLRPLEPLAVGRARAQHLQGEQDVTESAVACKKRTKRSSADLCKDIGK